MPGGSGSPHAVSGISEANGNALSDFRAYSRPCRRWSFLIGFADLLLQKSHLPNKAFYFPSVSFLVNLLRIISKGRALHLKGRSGRNHNGSNPYSLILIGVCGV